DGSGRLIRQFNEFGVATELAFDTQNFVVESTDALGNSVLLELDDFGRVVSSTDGLGHQTRTQYDQNGNATQIVLADGSSLRFIYDRAGNLVQSTNPEGQSTRLEYDRTNNLISRVNALGETTTYSYDPSGNLVSIRHPGGEEVTYENGSRGEVLATIDALGNRSTQFVDSRGLVTNTVDARGVERFAQYNGSGLEIGSSIELSPGQSISQSRAFDGNGNETGTIDALGQETSAEYDQVGNLVGMISTGGLAVQINGVASNEADQVLLDGVVLGEQVHDELGRLSASVNANGGLQRFEYDAAGRVTGRSTFVDSSQTEPISQVGMEYDSRGYLTASTDALGYRTTYEYDRAGNVTRVVDPLGNPTDYNYDGLGRLTVIVDSLSRRTTLEYDVSGNLTSVQRPDESKVLFDYDANGNLVKRNDELGNEVLYSYGATGLLIAVVDPRGGMTNYEHDALGNVIRTTDARGNVTNFEYDALSRRVSTTRPLGQQDRVTYTSEGAVASYSDFAGQTDVYTYDQTTGRLASALYGGDLWEYDFNESGQLTSVARNGEADQLTYDSEGRLLSRTHADGSILAYTYDLRGDVTEIQLTTENGQSRTTHEYDAARRLIRIANDEDHTVDFEYDAVGNLVKKIFSSGLVETFVYDAKDFLIGQSVESQDGQIVGGLDLTRDAFGNVLHIEYHDGGTQSFRYDTLQQLVQEETRLADGTDFVITYTFDEVGNRIERMDSRHGLTKYFFDENDRLVRTEGYRASNYRYDDNGRLVSIVEGDHSIEYEWDDRDRLVEVATSDTDDPVRYVYDDNGIVVSSSQGPETTHFIVDANRDLPQRLAVSDADGFITSSYLYANELLVQQTHSDAVEFVHENHIGSVFLVTNTEGEVVEDRRYGAFGESLVEVISDGPGFASGFHKKGLTYLRARFLDSETGRFLSTDPFEGVEADPVSLHRYLYAANSPQLYTDPTGERTLAETLTTIGIWGGLAAAGIAVVQQIVGLGRTVDWSGESLSVTYDPLAGKKPGGIHSGLIGSGRLGAPKAGPGKISAGFGIDYGSAVGGQFNRFVTENGLNQKNDNWDGNYVGISLTLLANVSFGLSEGGAVGASFGTFNVGLPRFFVKDLRNFQSLGLSGPYLLIDGSFSRGPVGETPLSFLQMGLARGDANGPSLQLGNEKSAGVTVTGGLTVPLGDSSIFGLFD
ncbi:MAG: RHS repeat-associated core domain-containing protein, partial [Planctomycetota bacterium]